MQSSQFVVVAAVLACAWSASPISAQHQMPSGTSHEEHLKQMQKEADLNRRGAIAMGFDQQATDHQFTLADDGGWIEVSVKDPADTKNLSAIRSHLKEIAASFKRGDFSKPFQTHSEVPPGVNEMKGRKDAIDYSYEQTPRGARVRIRTSDQDALKAIHAFLNYQIHEHHTGG